MSDYLDRYKRRVQRNGNDVGESLTANTIAFIESTFTSSPTYRRMTVERTNPDGVKEVFEMDARVIGIERLGTLRDVLLRPSDNLDIGSYVIFDDDTWLIFDKHGGTGSTTIKLTVIKCNMEAKWISKDDNVTPINVKCVASATDLGSKSKQSKNDIEWNKYDVRLPLGQMFISVEANQDTKTIDLNDRFIFGSKVYEVTGIDDITSIDKNGYGVIQFTVKITTITEGDNFTTGIAYNGWMAQESNGTVSETNEDGTGGMIW